MWLPMKMIALGGAQIEADNGKTSMVGLLTVPGKYDAFQNEGWQFKLQPPGQIEKFLASLPASPVRKEP